MDARERRRYEAEQRRLERNREDLEQERVVREQMEITKRAIQSVHPGNDLFVERLRGLVRLESGDTE